MNPQVAEYFDKIKVEWQAEICRRLNQLILQSVPGIEDRIQYGKPHYLKGGKYAFVLGTAKDWVSFTIFNAQNLNTPAGLFEASDDGSRKTIKIRKGQEVEYPMLEGLIQEATK